jgi:hypothetical protein
MDVLPRNIIFGMITFVAILLLGFTIMSEFASKDPSILNDNRYGTFKTKLGIFNNSMNTTLAGFASSVSSDTQDAGEFGWLSSLLGKGWSMMKGIGAYFQFGIDAFNGIAMLLGIPSWVVGIVITAIGVTVGFAIISAVFQKDV